MVQYFPIVTGSLTVTGSVNVSGSITTNSTITATTLVVQTITSSISAITGSTQFGSLLTNTHIFSGSVTMNPNGLFVSSSGNVGIGTINPYNKLEVNGTIRSTTQGDPTSGVGMELFYRTTDTSSYLQSYDRTNSAWKDVRVYGNTLYFGSQGSNNLIISSSGNIGIGTETPRSLLDIRFNADRGIRFSSPGVSSEGTISSYQGSVTNNLRRLRLAGDSIYFNTGDGSDSTGTERMGIASNGIVSIAQAGNGHTTGGFTLYNTISNSWNLVVGGDNNLYFGYNGTSKGYIINTTGAYTALSDVNKKKDFEESNIGLSAILGLKPTLYRMKEDDESLNKQLGFIAQEVKEFIPQAYVESINGDDKFIGLIDRPIIAALVKAIQELTARVQELENK